MINKKYFLALLLFLNFNAYTYASTSKIERIGDVTQIALPVFGAGLAIYKQDWLGLQELTYAGLGTIATVQIIKHVVHRERPNGHMNSFPSGHTAAAFWGAGFLQMRYGWKYGIPAYALAAFTGYSRIQSHNHWTSDVIAGAGIGLFFSYLFTQPYADKLTLTNYADKERKEEGFVLTANL